MTAIEFLARAATDLEFHWNPKDPMQDVAYEEVCRSISRVIKIEYSELWLFNVAGRPDRQQIAADALYLLQQDSL